MASNLTGVRVNVRFWGVRGSIPIPGQQTSRYGGNTSCVQVISKDGSSLVLDCGTGARDLGRELVLRQEGEVDILFTHFHMDHLFGFPFFGPIFSPNFHVNVGVPAYSGADAQEKLGRYLNGIYHPLRIHEVAARLLFQGVHPGRPFERGAFDILGISLNHPGGSCGYCVTEEGRSVVYLTDTAPLARPNEGICAGKEPPPPERRVLEAMAGADLVIMDAMFTWEEYLEKMTWGHAYPEYAVRLATEAGARRIALFHHAPDASDADLDRLAAHWAQHDGPEVILAREGMTIDLSAPDRAAVSYAGGGSVDLEG